MHNAFAATFAHRRAERVERLPLLGPCNDHYLVRQYRMVVQRAEVRSVRQGLEDQFGECFSLVGFEDVLSMGAARQELETLGLGGARELAPDPVDTPFPRRSNVDKLVRLHVFRSVDGGGSQENYLVEPSGLTLGGCIADRPAAHARADQGDLVGILRLHEGNCAKDIQIESSRFAASGRLPIAPEVQSQYLETLVSQFLSERPPALLIEDLAMGQNHRMAA